MTNEKKLTEKDLRIGACLTGMDYGQYSAEEFWAIARRMFAGLSDAGGSWRDCVGCGKRTKAQKRLGAVRCRSCRREFLLFLRTGGRQGSVRRNSPPSSPSAGAA